MTVVNRFERYVRLTVVGWALFVCVGLVIALGPDSWANGAVFSVIGLLIGLWVWLRRSRPALVVSLVIATLHSLEQVGYVTSDVTDSSWGLLAADIFGLIVGLVIVSGSFLALRASRLARAREAATA